MSPEKKMAPDSGNDPDLRESIAPLGTSIATPQTPLPRKGWRIAAAVFNILAGGAATAYGLLIIAFLVGFRGQSHEIAIAVGLTIPAGALALSGICLLFGTPFSLRLASALIAVSLLEILGSLVVVSLQRARVMPGPDFVLDERSRLVLGATGLALLILVLELVFIIRAIPSVHRPRPEN